MHEHGITSRLLEVVLARAAAAGATRVSDVHIEIGVDSDVAPEALEHYWPDISAGTEAEGARLVFGHAADPWACRVVAIDVPDPVPEARPGRSRESVRRRPSDAVRDARWRTGGQRTATDGRTFWFCRNRLDGS